MFRPPHLKRLVTMAGLLLLAGAAAACGSEDQVAPVIEGLIEPETFIAVYVDLRTEAIRSPQLTLSQEARDEVLDRHAVDEQELIAFVEAHGQDLDYMNQVWTEVEGRIEALPPVTR